jgi:hypothetical protein
MNSINRSSLPWRLTDGVYPECLPEARENEVSSRTSRRPLTKT